MGMELMYAVCAGIILVFILILISCRLALKPYKELIKTLQDKIENLEEQLDETKSQPKRESKAKKEED